MRRNAPAGEGAPGDNQAMTPDRARYWRSAEQPLEAMYARFTRHVYHRHSHDTYSFGLTEAGAQSFTCRGAGHTSAAGMVMAFNPDDPHDGHATDDSGFVYRMVHIGPALIEEQLADITGRTARLPLFAEPVVDDPVIARRLRALHTALFGGGTALRRDELLTSAILALLRRAQSFGAPPAAARPPVQAQVPAPALVTARDAVRIVERARDLIHDRPAEDLSAARLAAELGCSRFAVYRAFHDVLGLAPSEYRRQLRLRTARDLIARGHPLAEAAAASGFADQAHLTRWFSRCFGVTPGAYRRACASADADARAGAGAAQSAGSVMVRS